MWRTQERRFVDSPPKTQRWRWLGLWQSHWPDAMLCSCSMWDSSQLRFAWLQWMIIGVFLRIYVEIRLLARHLPFCHCGAGGGGGWGNTIWVDGIRPRQRILTAHTCRRVLPDPSFNTAIPGWFHTFIPTFGCPMLVIIQIWDKIRVIQNTK